MFFKFSPHLKYSFWSIFIFLILAINSASTQNSNREQQSFIDTISIYTEIGLIFTNVIIEGKSYKFLIDTGAPFVILEKNKKLFKLRKTSRTKIRDSNQQKRKVKSGIIEDLVIGSKKYDNTRATILNLEGPILNCLDFDGIIGANLMANAIWQFDLSHNQIIVTDDLALLDQDLGTSTPMRLNGMQKSPYIKVRINSQKPFEALFDSGYTNLFTLDRGQYKLATTQTEVKPTIKFYGFGSEGAFGRQYETTEYTKFDSLHLGNELFTPGSFRISEDDNSKIGAKYLKGKLVTLDFLKQKFYTKKMKDQINEMAPKTFGFSPNIQEGEIVVGTIKRGSDLVKKISIGDPILRVDDIQIDNSCNQLIEIREKMESQSTISISVQTKNGVQNFDLDRYLIVE